MSDKDFSVTQKEAADFLRVSTKTISRHRKKGLPYKMLLNPVTGKQEVRFRRTDLERWEEGRQLLANHGCSEEPAGSVERAVPALAESGGSQALGDRRDDYLSELLAVYKDQIQALREQLQDMRGQLSRRDRQIDDLMRMMVGLQLEYKPEGEDHYREVMPAKDSKVSFSQEAKKIFSREQLSESILRLRQKGKRYEEIANGLNSINAATLTGHSEWTVSAVKSLLPALVDMDSTMIVENSDY